MTSKQYGSDFISVDVFCGHCLHDQHHKMRKILFDLKVVPFRKLAFLYVFFLLVLRLKLILQQDLSLLRIRFALFVVNNAHREFRHANMSFLLLSSLKMNLYDATPYYQEVGGVTKQLNRHIV